MLPRQGLNKAHWHALATGNIIRVGETDSCWVLLVTERSWVYLLHLGRRLQWYAKEWENVERVGCASVVILSNGYESCISIASPYQRVQFLLS